MKTILVPIDFSPVTRSVVAQAASLAKTIKARLVLLHVVQPPAMMANYGIAGEAYAFPVLESIGEAADRNLKLWQRRLQTRGVRSETVQREDASPARIIAKEAKRCSAKYIVIGSHGHTAFYELLIGGTTTGVLKAAPCPVLIVSARLKIA